MGPNFQNPVSVCQTLGVVQALESMTARQLDRRRRVLDAAHALLAEVPVHEVQVKDIAERSGVSLAAIYNYFSSKDHLLGEALVDWAHGLTERATRAVRRGSDYAELVRRGVRAYGRSPQYAVVFLQTAASTDEHAIECMGRLSSDVGGTLSAALGHLDPEAVAGIQRIVGNAWTGGLFECVHGGQTFAELERSLATACRVLVEAAESSRL